MITWGAVKPSPFIELLLSLNEPACVPGGKENRGGCCLGAGASGIQIPVLSRKSGYVGWFSSSAFGDGAEPSSFCKMKFME